MCSNYIQSKFSGQEIYFSDCLEDIIDKSNKIFDDLTGDGVEEKVDEFYCALVGLLESKDGKTGKLSSQTPQQSCFKPIQLIFKLFRILTFQTSNGSLNSSTNYSQDSWIR